MSLDFDEGDELRALRAAVADLGSRYGQAYFLEQARSGGRTDALWSEVGKAGFIGVNLPEEYGGGGGGMVELSIVLEAMKMQHPVVAGAPGVVRSLDVVPGAQVDAGAVLAVIEQEASA